MRWWWLSMGPKRNDDWPRQQYDEFGPSNLSRTGSSNPSVSGPTLYSSSRGTYLPFRKRVASRQNCRLSINWYFFSSIGYVALLKISDHNLHVSCALYKVRHTNSKMTSTKRQVKIWYETCIMTPRNFFDLLVPRELHLGDCLHQARHYLQYLRFHVLWDLAADEAASQSTSGGQGNSCPRCRDAHKFP